MLSMVTKLRMCTTSTFYVTHEVCKRDKHFDVCRHVNDVVVDVGAKSTMHRHVDVSEDLFVLMHENVNAVVLTHFRVNMINV